VAIFGSLGREPVDTGYIQKSSPRREAVQDFFDYDSDYDGDGDFYIYSYLELVLICKTVLGIYID
jgi:hypothetical protein